MARMCLHCGKLEAPPDSRFCERCRVTLIKSGMVDLALPGELDQATGQFTPYIELTRAQRAAGVLEERRREERRRDLERRAGSVKGLDGRD